MKGQKYSDTESLQPKPPSHKRCCDPRSVSHPSLSLGTTAAAREHFHCAPFCLPFVFPTISHNTLQTKQTAAHRTAQPQNPHQLCTEPLRTAGSMATPLSLGGGTQLLDGSKAALHGGASQTQGSSRHPPFSSSLHQSSSPSHRAACLQRTGLQPVTFSQCCGAVGGFPPTLGLSPSFL